MKLSALLSADNNQERRNNLLHMERFVNDAKGKFSEYSDVNPQFGPRSNMSEFAAPYIVLDKSSLEVHKHNPDDRLMEAIFQDGFMKFIFHPDMKDEFPDHDGVFTVSPHHLLAH